MTKWRIDVDIPFFLDPTGNGDRDVKLIDRVYGTVGRRSERFDEWVQLVEFKFFDVTDSFTHFVT